MKHTPGPWQLKSAHDPYVVIGNVDGPDDGRYHFTNVCEVVTDDDDEAIANARLIAAAPDGLALAEKMYLRLLQRHDVWRAYNQDVYCDLRDFIAQATGQEPEDVQNEFEARAAIAKAEGK